jgi:23S rRNA (guanosine2251-2'-O)-methyltransferase
VSRQGRRKAGPGGDGERILGRNAVLEVLRAGRRPVARVLIADGVRKAGAVEEIVRLAQAADVPLEVVALQELEAGPEKSHGVAADVAPYPYVALEDILLAAGAAGEGSLILLLDEIQDPQNLGTLLRTAEAVGVQGVVLPYRRAAGVTPAVVRSSSGATEHLPIALENLAQAIERLQREQVYVVGLEQGAPSLEEVDLRRPLAMVIGSEGEGLRRLVRERCDTLRGLPVGGRIGSLNAAVAGSIALYLAWTSRRRPAMEPAGLGGIDAPGES